MGFLIVIRARCRMLADRDCDLIVVPAKTTAAEVLAMNPDGSTIVTGAGDETLRFWNIFPCPSRPQEKIELKIEEGMLLR